MIHRHNRCWGISLFRWGKYQIEFWFCPKAEFIQPHVHLNVDSKIVYLGGNMLGTIGSRTKQLGWKDIFHCYPIPRNTVHSGVITGLFCCFLNVEKWVSKKAITSAAIDFERI